MTNDKSSMTKEFPNSKRQNCATLSARRSGLEFRAWSFFSHLPLVICHSTARLLPLVLLLMGCGMTKAAPSNETLGKPLNLEFQPLPAAEKTTPPALHLRGKDARQQLLVTAKFGSGALRDCTRRVSYTVSPPDVVRIDKAGRVTPLGDGTATV